MLRRPPGLTLNEPLLGLTVTPFDAVAVQVIVCGAVQVDCAPTFADPLPPGLRICCAGEAKPMAATYCVPYDGGASCGAAPQSVFGVDPMVKSRVPPVVIREGSSQSWLLGWPFTFRDWM